MKYIMSPCWLIEGEKQTKLAFKHDPEQTGIVIYLNFFAGLRKKTIKDIVGFQVKNSKEIVYRQVYFDKKSLIDFIDKHTGLKVDPKTSASEIKDLSLEAIRKILEKNKSSNENDNTSRNRSQSLCLFGSTAAPTESERANHHKRATFNLPRFAF